MNSLKTNEIAGQMKFLFSMITRQISGEKFQLAMMDYPLARREGGTIGSAESLKDPHGSAILPSIPDSGQASLFFVADWKGHVIRVYDADSGVLLRSIGSGVAGHAPGQLNGPRDVVVRVLPSGLSLLYVSDFHNHRVQVFDAQTGMHVRMLGEGHLHGIECLALHDALESSIRSTLLFVATGQNVKVFDADSGALIRTLGSPVNGDAGKGLCFPAGLALRSIGEKLLLYIAENAANRVQVLDAYTGEHVRMIGEGDVRRNVLKYPMGIAVHPPAAGVGMPTLLYVVDYANNRLRVFDADTGTSVRIIEGEGLNRMQSPVAVTLHAGADGTTLLFVSDGRGVGVQVLVV